MSGASAGGHLVALLGTSGGKRAFSPISGNEDQSDPAKVEAVSPVHYVSKDNPPILILHGTADALVPYAQSVEFADALKKAGVDVIL